MPRVRPDDRFDQLARTAADVFIRSGGFARTQIGDVATALGVAKGTVYLYVESKEALFDLALRSADAPGPIAPPRALPIPTPAPGSTLSMVRRRLTREGKMPSLAMAESEPAPSDATAELGEIIGELYDVLARNRRTIKLLSVTAAEIPELTAAWFGGGRRRFVKRLTGYLDDRATAGALAPAPDSTVAARVITESTSWLAVHRHWDPAPQPMKETATRATAIALGRAFAPSTARSTT